MKKNELTKLIAEQGYNAGFGAKINLSSFDLVRFIPPTAGCISLIVGISGLGWEEMTVKTISFSIISLSILALYASLKSSDIVEYESAGVKITKIYRALRDLHAEVSSGPDEAKEEHISQYKKLVEDLLVSHKSDQVLGAGIFAHYKLFFESNSEWFVSELGLSFFRDKVPSSLKFGFIFLVIFFLLIVMMRKYL